MEKQMVHVGLVVPSGFQLISLAFSSDIKSVQIFTSYVYDRINWTAQKRFVHITVQHAHFWSTFKICYICLWFQESSVLKYMEWPQIFHMFSPVHIYVCVRSYLIYGAY